jgi:hypothetical protein
MTQGLEALFDLLRKQLRLQAIERALNFAK